jgi:hypothetical protein
VAAKRQSSTRWVGSRIWNDLRRIAAAVARSSFVINASVRFGARSRSSDVSDGFCFRPDPSVRGLAAARLLLLSRPLGPGYCNATIAITSGPSTRSLLLVRGGRDTDVTGIGVKRQCPPSAIEPLSTRSGPCGPSPSATYANRPLWPPLCEPRFRRNAGLMRYPAHDLLWVRARTKVFRVVGPAQRTQAP